MTEELRAHIGEIYDGGAWEKVTGTFWKNGDPWDIWKFEHLVNFLKKGLQIRDPVVIYI